MKKHTLFFTGMLAAALVLGLVLTGCEDATTPAVPTVTGVTVSAAAGAGSVISGQTLQFSAAVAGTNGPSQAVTWAITTADVVNGTGISTDGLLTVAVGETKTSLEIKATSTADTTKSGTKSVTVTPANTAAITTVTITGTAALGQTLTAAAKSADSKTVTDAAFQWQRADTSSGTYADIAGAIASTYIIVTADKDKYLKVSAINTATGSTAKLSSATGPVTAPLITYTAVQVGGVSDTTTSTGIALTFNEAVTGLTASEITLTNGTGAATKSGEPTGSGTTWSLGISGVSQGNVSVSINKTGIESAEKTVAVYKVAPTALTFAAATTSIFGSSVKGVAYGGGTFVAVGLKTTIGTGRSSVVTASSTDGISWTEGGSGFSNYSSVNGVAYGDGTFVAGGDNGTIGRSTNNGTSWSVTQTGAISTINGVAYGNGTFVAVGTGGGGNMVRSTNGTGWTVVTSTGGLSGAINGVAYGGDKFIAFNSGNMATSPDGTTWTAVTSTGGLSGINGVAYGNGTFVAVGANGKMATSPDGTTWTAVSTTAFGTTTINGIAYGGDKFVAVGGGGSILGGSGKIASSTNGTTWTAVSATAFDTTAISPTAINGVAYGGNKFVAFGVEGSSISGSGGGKIAYSNPQE